MNQQLDINTERGSIAADDQLTAAKIVFPAGGKYSYFLTPMDGAARIDGGYSEGRDIKGLFEVKSRDESLISFSRKFNWEWLLTYQKLEDLSDASTLFGVPSYGLLYLNKDKVVLVTKLTDERGRICCHFRTDQTETKATCNGGTAVRVNAFIDVRNAKQIRG